MLRRVRGVPFGRGQFGIGRQQGQWQWWQRLRDGRSGRGVEQEIVQGWFGWGRSHAKSAGCIALGVTIDQQDLLLAVSERGGEVDGGGGLSDPAFLVRYCNNAMHRFIPCDQARNLFHVKQSSGHPNGRRGGAIPVLSIL